MIFAFFRDTRGNIHASGTYSHGNCVGMSSQFLASIQKSAAVTMKSDERLYPAAVESDRSIRNVFSYLLCR